MDRTVLLLLLCVQVFLLIAAFTSTDAATLPDEPQRQSLDAGIIMDDRRQGRRIVKKSCASRPGACSFLSRPNPNIPPNKDGETTSMPLQVVLKKN